MEQELYLDSIKDLEIFAQEDEPGEEDLSADAEDDEDLEDGEDETEDNDDEVEETLE